MKFLKTMFIMAIAVAFINVSIWNAAYATDGPGSGIISGKASESTLNFSTVHNGSKEWKSTGVTGGIAGQKAGGGFVGISLRFEARATLDVSGSSYSQSFRDRHVSWDGTQTEFLGSEVGATTTVLSSKRGLVLGGFTAKGGAATLSVQGFSDPSGGAGAVAGAVGQYSGAAGMGKSYQGAANGYSYTQTVKGIGGYNGSYSEAGMSVAGRMVNTGRSGPGPDPQ
jgi:hypothetical protein